MPWEEYIGPMWDPCPLGERVLLTGTHMCVVYGG